MNSFLYFLHVIIDRFRCPREIVALIFPPSMDDSRTAKSTCAKRPLFQTTLAFTLVEILVVGAILLILAAIAWPFFDGARSRSASSRSVNNLKQWGTGILLYSSENDGRLPAALDLNTSNYRGWDFFVAPYMNLPLANEAGSSARPPESLTLHANMQPPRDPQGRSRRSYAMPREPGGAGIAAVGRNEGRPILTLGAIPAPARTILLTERATTNNIAYSASAADLSLNALAAQQPARLSAQGKTLNPGGRYNYLFVDGHVKSLQVQETLGTGSTNSPKGFWTIDPND